MNERMNGAGSGYDPDESPDFIDPSVPTSESFAVIRMPGPLECNSQTKRALEALEPA